MKRGAGSTDGRVKKRVRGGEGKRGSSAGGGAGGGGGGGGSAGGGSGGKAGLSVEDDLTELLRENRLLRKNSDDLKESQHKLEIQAKDLERKLIVQNELIKRYRRQLVTAFENDSLPLGVEGTVEPARDQKNVKEPSQGNGNATDNNSAVVAAQTSSDSSTSDSSAGETED